MKISVIIPVYNLENYLTTCLESVSMQNFDRNEFEVLVVFDSCTDGSKAKYEAWKTANPDINTKSFDVKYQKAGLARNVAIDNASGEWLMFVDGDDFLLDCRAFDILYNAGASEEGITCVFANDYETNIKRIPLTKPLWRHFLKREVVEELRLDDSPTSEHLNFLSSIKAKELHKEKVIDFCYYDYRHLREGSVTHTRLKEKRENLL